MYRLVAGSCSANQCTRTGETAVEVGGGKPRVFFRVALGWKCGLTAGPGFVKGSFFCAVTANALSGAGHRRFVLRLAWPATASSDRMGYTYLGVRAPRIITFLSLAKIFAIWSRLHFFRLSGPAHYYVCRDLAIS